MYYRSFEQMGGYSSESKNPTKYGLVMGNVKAVYDGEQYLFNEDDYYLKSRIFQYLSD